MVIKSGDIVFFIESQFQNYGASPAIRHQWTVQHLQRCGPATCQKRISW